MKVMNKSLEKTPFNFIKDRNNLKSQESMHYK